MNIKEELTCAALAHSSAVTIGIFDGVHIGHRHLISELTTSAKAQGLISVVITFTSHPAATLNPQCQIPLITPLEERLSLLRATGVDNVIPLAFTSELARMSAREFATMLIEHLHMHSAVLGPDATIGYRREVDAEGFKRLGEELGFAVTIIPPLILEGERVSSSTIRRTLASGNIGKVTCMLGRYFRLSGKVMPGSGRGKNLGFPTANILPSPCLALPADGTYATLTHIGTSSYPSVTNVGTQPTFNGGNRLIETHIIGFSGDLYSRELTIDVVYRIRGEQHFETMAALQKQISKDVDKALTILSKTA